MNADLKKALGKVKTARAKLEGLIKDQKWVGDARKFAEMRSKEVKKLISADVTKVKAFIEKERKQLGKFQKQIPAEVEKVKSFVKMQGKELEKILGQVRKGAMTAKKKKPRKAAKKATTHKSGGSTSSHS